MYFYGLDTVHGRVVQANAVSGTGRVNDADRSKFDRGCALRNDTAAEPVKINIHSNPGDSCFGQRPLRSPLFLTYTSFSPLSSSSSSWPPFT